MGKKRQNYYNFHSPDGKGRLNLKGKLQGQSVKLTCQKKEEIKKIVPMLVTHILGRTNQLPDIEFTGLK